MVSFNWHTRIVRLVRQEIIFFFKCFHFKQFCLFLCVVQSALSNVHIVPNFRMFPFLLLKLTKALDLHVVTYK